MDCAGLSPQRSFHAAQFCHYFDAPRITASRFVKALIEQRAAVESEWPLVNGGGKDVPDFRQGDLPGAWSREHPPPAKG